MQSVLKTSPAVWRLAPLLFRFQPAFDREGQTIQYPDSSAALERLVDQISLEVLDCVQGPVASGSTKGGSSCILCQQPALYAGSIDHGVISHCGCVQSAPGLHQSNLEKAQLRTIGSWYATTAVCVIKVLCCLQPLETLAVLCCQHVTENACVQVLTLLLARQAQAYARSSRRLPAASEPIVGVPGAPCATDVT